MLADIPGGLDGGAQEGYSQADGEEKKEGFSPSVFVGAVQVAGTTIIGRVFVRFSR